MHSKQANVQKCHLRQLTNLLVVLDPHAQRVDQDGDHNSSAEVLAVHDLPERVAHQPPETHHLPGRSTQPVLLLFGPPAVPSVPVVEVLGELVYSLTVRVSVAALGLVGQSFGAVRAALRVKGQSHCVHSAEVTNRQLAGELGCSRGRKERSDGDKQKGDTYFVPL